MEPRTLIRQTIRKFYPTSLEVAIQYYMLLSSLNNLQLPPREVQLLAYTAVRGSISSGGAKEGFVKQFGSSKPTIGNIVYSLSKKGFLVKEGKSVRVHPQLRINFQGPLVVNLLLDKTIPDETK